MKTALVSQAASLPLADLNTIVNNIVGASYNAIAVGFFSFFK
jgi:hypothetical protein